MKSTLIAIATCALIASSFGEAHADHEEGVPDQVRWFASAGGYGYIKMPVAVSDDSGTCTSNYVRINKDGNEEHFLKLATAAQLAGRKLHVRAFSGCSGTYPVLTGLYLLD